MRKKIRKTLSPERLWQALDVLRSQVGPERFFQRRPRGNRRRKVMETGPQPFQLVKYFAFTSLSVILIASLVLSWVVSNKARQVLLARSEAYSLLFAENLNRQVFLQFVLPTVVRYGRIALSNEEQFARLDMIVRNITRGMGIDSVTIFDSRENIISYSTRTELVGKRNVGGVEYQKALQGGNSTVLESRGTIFNLLPGTPPVTCKLKTYIPFRQEHQFGERSGTIMGVIEVVKDLSGDLRAIIEMQARIIVLSLAIMGMLFGVLGLIVARGKRILEERAEERRRLEKKLHETQRLATLGKMVAAVSHEIKNPLGIVRSTAEILSKRISRVAPGNEHLADIIVEETTRLDNIVREFLDFARPRDPKMEKGSLNELILRVTRFMEQELEKHGVILNMQLYPHLPDVVMDSEQIYQVLLNMMFNAVQAMPEGGTLTLTTLPCASGAGVILKVADTGVGMEQEKVEQIFTPFFTDKNRGTGLGLAIAKNIVEKHGGRIEVESRQGEGSVFTVYLGCEKIPEPEMETGAGLE
ncbi:two-component system sensor histidine kinase NtrB [Desulfolithobacter sp.]